MVAVGVKESLSVGSESNTARDETCDKIGAVNGNGNSSSGNENRSNNNQNSGSDNSRDNVNNNREGSCEDDAKTTVKTEYKTCDNIGGQSGGRRKGKVNLKSGCKRVGCSKAARFGVNSALHYW